MFSSFIHAHAGRFSSRFWPVLRELSCLALEELENQSPAFPLRGIGEGTIGKNA